MSVLRLYEDSDLTEIVSLDGGLTNPDDETSLYGTDGETSEGALWVALEQTTLLYDIDDAVETIELAAARFVDTTYDTVICGTEKMLITDGHGTTKITVTRAYNDTTAASHSADDRIYLAYNCRNIYLDCKDETGTDESGWMTYCDDSGGSPDENWEAPHYIKGINYNTNRKVWRRLIVPASTTAQDKKDLIHNLKYFADDNI